MPNGCLEMSKNPDSIVDQNWAKVLNANIVTVWAKTNAIGYCIYANCCLCTSQTHCTHGVCVCGWVGGWVGGGGGLVPKRGKVNCQ